MISCDLLTTILLTHYFFKRQLGGGQKPIRRWKTLSHNGVYFYPPYEYRQIPLLYEGKEYVLNPLAEEYALLYARYLQTEYIHQPQFKKNFWKDWKPTLKNPHITSLDACDFRYFVKELDKPKPTIMIDEKYKTAIVDGVVQEVGNFRMEPPGIFIGRGNHPMLGRIKHRITPKDVTINIGKESTIPEGKSYWKKVVHDHTVEWLASWKDPITKKTKYVWLSNNSEFKKMSDIQKFDLARKLKQNITRISEENLKNLKSLDTKIAQLATALYLIMHLSLRIGNEKSKDETDTVGVTLLRKEHIQFDVSKPNVITLDFLGKDSVRFFRTTKIHQDVFENLRKFIAAKKSNQLIFDQIKSIHLNAYLKTFMKHLSAKVFRTYNASSLFDEELQKIFEYDKPDRIHYLLDMYNQANAKIAYICNHQKKVPKTFDDRIKKIDERIQLLKTKKKTANVQVQIEKLQRKKQIQLQLKELSVTTSKVNYIDPRITIAYMKRHDLPIEKFFSKKLMEKFQWAFDVDKTWRF